MKKPHIAEWLKRLLTGFAGHRYYTVVVALIAFVSTATFTFPFAIVLIPAVLIAPRRWLLLGLMSGLASGVGAAVLVELFNHLGQELVVSRLPDLVQSQSWQLGSTWLRTYGLFALLLIAGSPMPQTPALLFYSLVDPSVLGVLVAVSIGKTVKYVFLAWATYRYPARFLKYL
jgi:membrane protein YqaA with SNARE-associated domain